MKKLLPLLKKTIPWCLAATIFWFLFKRYPLPRLIEATRHANLLFLISFSIIYFLYIWVIDCWGTARTLRRFGIPTRTSELLQVRAASYLIMIVNYGVGQGTLAFFLNRKKNIPFLKISSVIFLIAAIDLYWVISFALIGSYFVKPDSGRPNIAGISLQHPIQILWVVSTLCLILLSVLAHVDLGRIAPGKRLQRLQSWSFFHILHEGHVRHYIATLMERLPMHVAINTSIYFVAWTFHSHIPFGVIISSIPIVILIGTIPITPGGLGTTQIATVALLKDGLSSPLVQQLGVSPEEIILSMSLVWLVANYTLKALFGILHIRQFYGEKKT